MNLIDKIKENPELLVRVGVQHRFTKDNECLENVIKQEIVSKIASYIMQQKLIQFEREEDNDTITLNGYCYMIDTKKLKQ